jgi:Domain of unknown function (DUF4331)
MSPNLKVLMSSGVLAAACVAASPASTASHREAPLIATDPSADNTDTYAFVSYDADNLGRPPADRKVTFVMNVIPGQNPSDGPNYFEFDPRVQYSINVDNDQDGIADDIVYEFRFVHETRPVAGTLNFPLPYLGNPNIGAVPQLQGITALDGPGSEGLTRRQRMIVNEIRDGQRRRLFQGQILFAVPSNVGPATMPNYEDLASQGIYDDSATGIRVFAGQRAETFYIDLGAVFDTVNLRRFPPVLTAAEDANDRANPFGNNRFTGANVHTIAIEVPIARLTSDGRAGADTIYPVIGMYASTARAEGGVVGASLQSGGDVELATATFTQTSRLANPLVNELIINTPAKDAWNAGEPEDEARFQKFYRAPSLATALNLIFGLPVPNTPRTDLMALLLKYRDQPLDGTNCGTPCAELLRLDLRVPPVSAEKQKRLGGLAGDGAGFPNGRRPNDDVTDIATRVVGGQAYIDARVGDGVNFLAGALGAGTSDGPGYGTAAGNRLDVTRNGIAKEFPFLPTPYDGRNRRSIDCGERGGNPCN